MSNKKYVYIENPFFFNNSDSKSDEKNNEDITEYVTKLTNRALNIMNCDEKKNNIVNEYKDTDNIVNEYKDTDNIPTDAEIDDISDTDKKEVEVKTRGFFTLKQTNNIDSIIIDRLIKKKSHTPKPKKKVPPPPPSIFRSYIKAVKKPYTYSTKYSKLSETLFKKRMEKPLIKCPICKIGFNTEVSYNDHYLYMHHSRPFSTKNNYICFRCNQSFEDADDLDDHYSECDEEITTDTIPTCATGKYTCPTCENKYMTANFLGEHFILSHSNYDELTKLDDTYCKGFPGFSLLKKIGMIYSLLPSEIKKIMKADQECRICCESYQYCKPKYIVDENEVEDYVSDGEVIELQTGYSMSRSKSSDNLKVQYKQKRNITFKEHINIMNKILQKNTIPCRLTCCNMSICESCLEKHIETINRVICPYCKKDHENTYADYIREHEYVGNCNDSWYEWWKDNVDIFI